LTTFHGANDYATQVTDAHAVVNSEDKLKSIAHEKEKSRSQNQK
jgi:hypothetical protein